MIKVRATPSEDSRVFKYSFEDLNTTKEEWEAMSDAERSELLTEMLDSEPEQPFWTLDKIIES